MNTLVLTTENRPEALQFSNAVLAHARFEQGLIALNQVHKTVKRTPKGMIILGISGTGKTKLVRTYADMFNGSISETRDCKKVLIVDVFASNSVDQFYQSILDALGDPDPSKGRPGNKLHRIQVYVKKLCVEIIIFDEIHNLLPEYAGASTRKIANTIKTLMNLLKLPMVLVGEPDAKSLRTNHLAIAGRFPSTFNLYPLTCKEGHVKYFREYMQGLHELIGLPCMPLDTDEMLQMIFLATGGKAREISELITKAIEFTPPGKEIELVHFKKAFQMVDYSPLRDVDYNPFKLSNKELKLEMEQYL